MKTIPLLKTNRLTLRPFLPEDAKVIQRLAGDEKISATTLDIPHPYLDGAAEEWVSAHQKEFEEEKQIIWAISKNDSGELIGAISYKLHPEFNKAEFGFWVGVLYWNKGYAAEALSAIIKYGFEEMKLNKIFAHHFINNPASGMVMLKNGLKQEAYLKKDIIKNGKYVDVIVYSILKSEYKSQIKNKLNFYPELKTERLLLRRFKLSDAEKIRELAGDELISENTIFIPHPYPEGFAEKWIMQQYKDFRENKVIYFAVTLKDSGELIGAIGLKFYPADNKAETGFWIGVPHWNKGYASEALSAVLGYGFEIRELNKIFAYHFVMNPASGRVLEKNGFNKEGFLVDHIFKSDEYKDLKLLSILRSEYLSHH